MDQNQQEDRQAGPGFVPLSLGPPWTAGAAQSLLSRELAVSWITREHSPPHSDPVITQSLESLSSPAHSSLQAAETTGTIISL